MLCDPLSAFTSPLLPASPSLGVLRRVHFCVRGVVQEQRRFVGLCLIFLWLRGVSKSKGESKGNVTQQRELRKLVF